MRRGSKHITKKVFIPEENEEEKYRKVQAKKIQLRAEFEKHKKEILVNTTDISKSSEIRLKNQLEELMNANERRTKELERLENIESRLENTNMEATYFYEQISKLEASKDNETYLSVGFHPNRTTSTMFGVRHSNFLDSLGDKKAQLLDTLANIELLLEQEEDATSATQEKYQDMKKDQILLSKKIHELEKMNDHADKRFTDLQRIEFLAMNRHAASTSNLKTVKDDLREIKNQEVAYKKQKETDKKREIEFLNAKQNEVSNVLVELDRKRQEDQQKQEELRRLELQHEEMRVKRKNTRIVTQYIEIFHALQGENRLNLGAINQALKDISDQMDSSRSSSHKPPSVPEKKSSSRNNSRDNSPTRRSNRPGSEEPASPIKINSAVQRNVYIEKIQRFYEKFVEGPERLAETIIKRYLDNCFKEESLKNGFEEMQNRKKRQENELQKLEKELEVMKARNEYIGQGYTGSKILDSNEQEAIDSGMLTINKLPTTLSQAKFDFEHKKTVDKEIDLVNSTEAFVMRCYFDTVEMMTRFSKLLNSIQATSGGNIPSDLKELIKTAQSQLQFVRKEKKANQQLDVSMSGALSEGRNDLHINLTENGNGSATEVDQKIDLREINDMFLSMFEGYHNEAAQFTTLVNNDVIISSFITLEDIKKYLQSFQREVFLEAQIQKVLTETTDLRETALKNMLEKFNICYKLYTDLLAITQQSADYTCNRLKARGYDVHSEDIDRRESEPNEYLEKAVHKKWQNLVDKYDYDPGRDFRKENMETETTDDNFGNYHRDHLDDMEAAERELWDNDDFNSKLNEMMGTGFGKTKAMKQFENNQTLFKSRTEVEARKAQLKKEKEKQKRIAMENMTDDEFLDWQRKQMKKDGQEDIEEEKPEYDAKRKAQLEMTQRLSPTMRVEELKRMIGNSKLLSKIQILEKQRFATDERNNFKLTSVENYVPLEPKKIVKNPTSPEYKIRIRKAQTPTDRVTRTRFMNENSDRLSEPEENVEPLRDSALKIATTKSASKFKPQEIFEFGSVPNKVPERPHTQGSKRLRPFGDPRKWPLGDSIEESRQRSVEKSGSAVLIKSKSHNKLKRKKLLVQTIDNKLTENKSAVSKTKSGQSLLLKPEKPSKRLSASNKKLNLSTDKFLMKGQGPLYELLNKQADSRLNMVYAPNFFTGGLQNSSMTDDVNAFKNSGILVPEKL